jgi:uncharacterized protein (TIGR03083 family)
MSNADGMDHGDRIDAVERETRLIAGAFASAPRDAPVPTCPEWSLIDLATHVGEFTGLWTHVVCEASGVEKTPFAPPAQDEDLGAWYEPLGGHLVDHLRQTTAETPCWMWMDEQTAGCVARRCANELAIHRFDAQSASNTTTALDPDVAIDAIEEIFVMLPVWENPPDGSGKTLHLRATEGDERTITLGREGPRIHADGPHGSAADLTLTGSASDLGLLLYRRPTLGVVQRDGDATALDAWYRDFLFG